MDYYVYTLGNPITGEPFYVGIGKVTKHCSLGFRAKRHITEAIALRDRGRLQKADRRSNRRN